MPLDPARAKIVDKLLSGTTSVDDEEISADLDLTEKELIAELGESHPLANDSIALRRFLVARKLQVDDAKAMIEEHVKWRAANLPIPITQPLVHELKKGKIEPYGKDDQGRPVIIVRSGKFDPKERDLDVAISSVVYLIEKIVSEHPPGTSFIIFYDRSDFSIRKNWDFDFLKHVAGVLSSNYPERLAGAYVYPATMVLAGLWGLVKNFFEARTRSKIRFITSNAELMTLIPPEYVPTSVGGTSTHAFDPSTYDPLLEKVEVFTKVSAFALS